MSNSHSAPPDPPADEWVRLGRLGKTHGVNGELRLWPEADDASWYFDLDPGEIFLLKNEEHAPQPLRVEFRGWLGGAMLVALEGVLGPEAARPFAGAALVVHESRRPALPANEYYLDEVVGLKVLAPSGEEIGRVADIVQSGAKTFLSIQGRDVDLLVSPDQGLIASIDPESGVVRMKVEFVGE